MSAPSPCSGPPDDPLQVERAARRRLEAALAASEERFRIVVSSTLDIVYEVDLDGGDVRFHGDIDALLGSLHLTGGPTMQAWTDRIHPEDRPRVLDAVQRCIDTGARLDVRYRVAHADGSWRLWRDRGQAIQGDPDGRRRWVGAIIDITDAERATEALARSTAQLDALFASAPIGIGFWDREFRFLRVNERLAAMNGLPAQAHVGRTPEELLPGIDGLDALRTMFDGIVTTGRPLEGVPVTGQTPAEPGRTHHWHEHFFPLRHGEAIVGVGAVVEDVTEARAASAALAASERRYRAIFENAGAAIWDLDLSGPLDLLARWRADGLAGPVGELPGARVDALLAELRMTDVNGAALLLFGLEDRADAAERFARVLGQRARRLFGAMLDGVEAGRRRHEVSGRAPRTHGDEIDVLVSVTLPGIDERPAQALLSMVDVTPLKRAQAALEEADRRKDEFLAMLAHELRNPLAPIRYSVDILRTAGHRPETVERVRALLDRQVHQLAKMVDDLLDVSRVVHGKISLTRAPVRLQDIVHTALEATREAVRRCALHLDTAIAERDAVVEGDAVRLVQVVSNLLGNAVKFTPPGGRVGLTLSDDGAEAVIAVSDSGQGIEASLLPRIFDLFVQGEQDRDRSLGGLGIGLTVARRLVTMHGGRLTAESAGPGLGARFVVRLPLVSRALLAAAAPPKAARALEGRRVLVVDDNADNAESLALLLALQGCDVRTAPDAPSALDALARFDADTVMLDVGLPGIDGHELARRLRALPGPRRRLVAVSGYGREADLARSREAGIDRHLVKPVDLQAMVAALREVPPDVPDGAPSWA